MQDRGSKRLTAAAVENAKAAVKRRYIPDAGSGLYLVVQPTGAKSWACWYRIGGRQRKLTLGRFPAVSLATARAVAANALADVASGKNPASDKRAARAQAALPIGDAFRDFLDKHTLTQQGRAIRESTKRETGRLLGLKRDPADLNKWIVTGGGVLARWSHGKTLQAVTKREVRDLLDDLAETAPVTANRTLAALKTAFRFHLKRDNLAVSPAADVDDPAQEGGGRDRVLPDAELGALWRAAEEEGYAYGRMVQLLILTGCRLNEVRAAPRSEIDLAKREWLIPGARVKNGVDHLVPVGDMMASIVAALPTIGSGKLLFTTTGNNPISGLSKIKARLHKAMARELRQEPPPWSLHDIRRTFVSGLQRLGVGLEIREACVNHRTIRAGVAGIYGPYDYWPEKKHAFALWERHVLQAVEKPKDNLVSLERARA